MSWIKNFRAWDKRMGEKLDVKRIIPGYFNIWVFRTGMIFILILVLTALHYNDWSLAAYSYQCPKTETYCRNPFYECAEKDYEECRSDITCILPACNKEIPDAVCKKVNCHKQFLASGESIEPHPIVKRLNAYVLGIFAFSFVVNHFVYRVRTGNWLYRRPQK